MKVIVVSGATATGKTQLALELAEKFPGEIINFDSLLFYREINIGTAKPTLEERERIIHHMIDIRSVSSPMNAADFAKMSYPIIESILKRNKIVYLVGGSGFYLQALLKGMYDSQTTPKDILDLSEKLYSSQGIGPFLEILKINDIKSFHQYHPNDHYRIRRAVEHWWATGQPLSKSREKKDQENSSLSNPTIHPWKILHLNLDIPKALHLEIIKKRTSFMLNHGLINEVSNLIKQGYSPHLKPLQSIGYKETIDYILGKISSLEELQEKINISTRQLAKAQRTWFKKDSHALKLNPLVEKEIIFQQVNLFIFS